jgi:hypothetical protein
MINGGVEMNTTQKDNYISPDEYEVLQSKYDCKTEYADGEIWVSSSTASRDRVFKAYSIDDEYLSSVFTDLKINLKDIF